MRAAPSSRCTNEYAGVRQRAGQEGGGGHQAGGLPRPGRRADPKRLGDREGQAHDQPPRMIAASRGPGPSTDFQRDSSTEYAIQPAAAMTIQPSPGVRRSAQIAEVALFGDHVDHARQRELGRRSCATDMRSQQRHAGERDAHRAHRVDQADVERRRGLPAEVDEGAADPLMPSPPSNEQPKIILASQLRGCTASACQVNGSISTRASDQRPKASWCGPTMPTAAGDQVVRRPQRRREPAARASCMRRAAGSVAVILGQYARARSTRCCSGRPARSAATLAATSAEADARRSGALTCGSTVTCGCDQNGCDGGSGSVANTSSTAWRSWPLARAASRSASTTHARRAPG